MNDPDVQPELIARLAALCPDLMRCEDAWFMEPLDRLHEETPAAFVYLHKDGPAGGAETICPRQRVTMIYGIWLVCPLEMFRAQRQAIRNAVFGWCPSERHEPFVFRGGENDLRGEYAWWKDLWSVDTWLRNP